MKIKCLIAAMFVALLCVKCSNKDESQKQKNTENEMPLEGGGNVDEPMPREPKYQTKGCLRGCRGLPCDEAARCVKRNCSNVRIECENGEYEVFEEKSFNVKPHKKILCQKGCDDVPKNSVEYENCVLRNCPDAKFVISNKDFDPEDSIMVGVRAFRAAKKEFVKRWNYAKDTELFMDVVGKICREAKICASRLDSVAYKNDVTFILDSLMRNNILDSLIEAKEQEINESEKIAPWGHDDRLKNLEMSKKINEFIRKNE